MQRFVLNDVCCPAKTQDVACHGRLELDWSRVAVVCDPADDGEIIEGMLSCTKCESAYPILGGLPILVPQPELYLRDRYKLILSLVAEAGLSISREMIDWMHVHQIDVGPVSEGDDKYDTPSVLSSYLCQHYDSPWDELPANHPICSIMHDYLQQDFYEVALELLRPYLGVTQRVLDIGCGVGRSVYDLAGCCALVYGAEYAYGSAFVARRMLRHFPSQLETYWLQWDGDIRTERLLPDRRRDNVEIVVASGTDLPFPDSAFDLVSSWNVIDRVPEPEELLREKERVACTRGILAIADPYVWSTKYTPRHQWIGGLDEVPSADAIRDRIRTVSDIVQEQEYLPWLSWICERDFHLFFCHSLVARKRPNGEE